MFGVATPEDLRTLRTIITGAEKCPEALFARAKQMAPQATILEGYGITECSPVVSGNRPERIKPGTVGPPVNDVEVCVVDPDSKQPLPTGATGLLLVRGPSVFRGYLNYDGPGSVHRGRRAALVRDRRPGAVGRGPLHPLLRTAEAVPQGRRGDGLAAGPGRAVPGPLPTHGERSAGGRRGSRNARRPVDRALHHRGHSVAPGERRARRGRASAA